MEKRFRWEYVEWDLLKGVERQWWEWPFSKENSSPCSQTYSWSLCLCFSGLPVSSYLSVVKSEGTAPAPASQVKHSGWLEMIAEHLNRERLSWGNHAAGMMMIIRNEKVEEWVKVKTKKKEGMGKKNIFSPAQYSPLHFLCFSWLVRYVTWVEMRDELINTGSTGG